MKLLQIIIDTLSDEKGSLTDALLKTKVVLHKIGHKELAEWVNNELSGYSGDAEVPEYRHIASSVRGVINSMVMRMNDHPLPIKHLPKKWQDHYSRTILRSSVAQLESFATSSTPLTSQIAPEWYPRFSEPLQEGLVVIQAWIRIEPTQILRALVEIRSRLLDFLLNLQSEIGDAEGDDEVREAASKIDASEMFRGAVFGNNTTVLVGNYNTANIKNEIRHGDFQSLADALRKSNLSELDITELKSAIAADENVVDVKQRKFGPKVNQWIGDMMRKVVEASWNIELGIAGNLLTDALKAYYF